MQVKDNTNDEFKNNRSAYLKRVVKSWHSIYNRLYRKQKKRKI